MRGGDASGSRTSLLRAHLLGSQILSKAARIDFAQGLQRNFAKNVACNFRKIWCPVELNAGEPPKVKG